MQIQYIFAFQINKKLHDNVNKKIYNPSLITDACLWCKMKFMPYRI